MSVEIVSLLMEGHCFSKIAKLTGLSIEAIRKQALKYEREGLIIRVKKYPAQFQEKVNFNHPYKPVGDFNPPPYHPSKEIRGVVRADWATEPAF